MHSEDQATPELIARRKAAWALDMLCRHIQLGTLAISFDAEYDDEWAVVNMNNVRAIIDGKLVAEVTIHDDIASIVVPDVHDLIRASHLRDFVPEQLGIVHKTGENFMGDKEPDLVGDIPLPEPSEASFDGPHNPFPRMTGGKRARINGALSR